MILTGLTKSTDHPSKALKLQVVWAYGPSSLFSSVATVATSGPAVWEKEWQYSYKPLEPGEGEPRQPNKAYTRDY